MAQSVFKWLVGRLSVTEGIEKWRQIYHIEGVDEHIDSQSAMKLSSWWAAGRLITETVATLPMGFIQDLPDGDRKERPDLQVHTLLHDQPNDWQTPVEFWEGRVGPLNWAGNSFAEIKYIGDKIVALHPMPAAQTDLIRNEKYELVFKFTDRGKTYDLPPKKVFHIKGYAPNDEILGLSPIEYAARSLSTAISADRAAGRMYSKGLRAAGYFTAPPEFDLDETQRANFKKNYVDPASGGRNEGGTTILPPGFDFKNFGLTSKDAELLLSRGFSVEDVCRWMGVPPILIGHSAAGQTMWGSGVEQIILGWLALGLRAKLRRIESAVNYRLLTADQRLEGIGFEFKIEGLLRADSAARAALMSVLAQNGLRTRNELRAIDNYNKVDGADDLTVQSNLIPLEKLGEQPAAPSAPVDPQMEAVKKQVNDAHVMVTEVRNWLMNERKSA